MAEHTPGPWRIEDQGDEFHIIAANGDWVATVHGGIDSDQANANLFTAAPKLLAALKDLFEQCAMVHKHWGEDSNSREADAAIAAAQVAIAEAEGKQ